MVVLFGALLAAGAGLALTRLGEVDRTLGRLEDASPALLALAIGFEVLSYCGYVVLTQTVLHPASRRIGWRESVDITLAGVVATRLLTAGGVGGLALTLWALRAAGLDGRSAGRHLAAFLAVLYAVFFAALAIAGAGVAAGVLDGGTPRVLALGGAVIGTAGLVLGLAALLRPPPRRGKRLAAAAALVRDAVRLGVGVASSRPLAVPAAIAWWGFDIAVLWTTFDIFGTPPAAGVLILGYFLGQLAQIVPLPGGVGPVEGGMIGVFAASGVSLATAVVAVVSYRVLSTWLPALPGLWAYADLRRRVGRWRAEDETHVQLIRAAEPV